MNATYSPEDNKLRLYSSGRLPKDIYERVRAAGFIYAPKQELFVAPMWTPSREDLLIELCGEIGDEDTSLVDRAEQRAERFEDYSASRAADADQAHKTVEGICEHIPFGQPILVGHHSERHARKDAERIENGMRKAVKMWEQSKYWEERAAGALAHAKYKEDPSVRARRIKGIEADKRKMLRNRAEAQHCLRFWLGVRRMVKKSTGERFLQPVNRETALDFCNMYDDVSKCFTLAEYPRTVHTYEGTMSLWSALGGSDGPEQAICTVEQAKAIAVRVHTRTVKWSNRWLSHYENRLTYERAMLADGGGLVGQKFPLAVGGQVKRRGSWYVIAKVNLTAGQVRSVSVFGLWKSTVQIEEIQDYRAPKEGDFEKVKAVTTTPPLCNYPGKGVTVGRLSHTGSDMEPADCTPITQAEWDDKHKDYKGTRIVDATETHARHRVRFGMFSKKEGYCAYVPVYITDAKIKKPPTISKPQPAPELPQREQRDIYAGNYKAPEPTKFDALKETLKAGVKIVSAPQLFPTPPELAKKMVEAAGMLAGRRVLEPSAGTGSIIEAAARSTPFDCFKLVAVEVNQALCNGLQELRRRWLYANEDTFDIRCADFLQCNGDIGKFDVILMNPPFVNGSDIEHIKHARNFLKPGGILVAICAGGPRQKTELEPLSSLWEPLPAGTFKSSGTNVSTVLLTIEN